MKKTVSYTIDENLLEPIKKRAKKERRSKSQIVENAIAKDLNVKL